MKGLQVYPRSYKKSRQYGRRSRVPLTSPCCTPALRAGREPRARVRLEGGFHLCREHSVAQPEFGNRNEYTEKLTKACADKRRQR
jgi:hypothetical protein